MSTIPSLSVIVPVYNVAPYLKECVDSLLSQRFADFEVLLIDDGSTDGSRKLCDDFSEIDRRVVALHKKNGGACSARNYGIDNARGEYIVFIDADDFVTDSYLDHLMESESDMVITGLQMFGTKNDLSMPESRVDFGIDGLAPHWNTPPVMNYLYCYPVAKRFKVKIIQDNDIRFDESLFFSEDLYFNMRYYCYAETFTELPYADYLYRITDITRDEKYKMGAEELISHRESLEDCFDSLYRRIGTNTLSFVRDNLNLRLVRKLYSFLMQEGITSKVFVQNIKLFREQVWADYMMGLLIGKRERRVMREAVRFPLLTYCVEYRLQRTVHKMIGR